MKRKISKNTITDAAATIGGAIAAGFVKKTISKAVPNIPAVVGNALPLVVGIFLTGQRNSMIKALGVGMIAKGGFDLAAAFIPGISAPGDDDIFSVSAPADQSILALPADQSILAGLDSFDGIEAAEDFDGLGAMEDDE